MMLRDQLRVKCRLTISRNLNFSNTPCLRRKVNSSEVFCFEGYSRKLLKVVGTSIRIRNWDLNNFKILDLWGKTNFLSEQNFRSWDQLLVNIATT